MKHQQPSPKGHLQRYALATFACLAFAANSADYQSTVLTDSPKAYYRLNDDTSRTLINKNSGSLGAAGNATNDLAYLGGVVHPFPGALAGDGNRAEFFDFTTRTEIPFDSVLNTPNTLPFSVEAWFYPASDQTATGMGVLANRYTQGANRQGWVMYQRKPNADYFGGEQVGWGFRMYNGVGGSSPLDTVSLAPYEVGKWQHVVVVYDPVDANNASVTMYINGVATITNTYSGAVPGYAPCTGDHPPGEAVNGQPAMALGNYNNANSGTFGAANPWYGAIDEFAWYPAKLTPAQILAHYQNGTNANRSTPYDTLIKSHSPTAYLRLDEIAPGPDVAVNIGDLRNTGIASHTAEVRHPASGAVASDQKSGAAAYHNRNGKSTTTMPFLNGNNPNAGIPFTFETWLRPMRDLQGGQSPVNNRWPNLGHRTGWVMFQRNPNLTYPSSEGHGWNFRMYDGVSGTGQDVLTDTDYVIGQWQHLVFTWEPQVQNGDVGGNGNDQWQGVLTAYVSGVAVASNQFALYAANLRFPEGGGIPADFAVGSYNAASTLGNNPFEGDVGEVAFYNNYVLTPDQILAHYQAGTNSNSATNYSTLVMTAGFTGPERVGLPKTYLRFNDPAYYPAANNGTVGYLADGNLVMTTNLLAGPRPPAYAGFSATNAALPLDGVKQWASFNNPAGLEFSGQITLEAWIQPGSVQGDQARIISHGPPTISDFLGAATVPDNAVTNSAEVFLRIDGAGAEYVVGSASIIYTNNVEIGTNSYTASFPVPAGDLTSGNWVYLAGTYDGTKWRLYRNGVEVASSAAAVGALPVMDGDWAVGSTGNGWAGNFAGGADEIAIYDKALTSSQVAAHYSAGKAGTTVLTINKSGNNVTITWPAGTTLQQSGVVTGTYTNVPGNPVSPLTVPASGTAFYRWKL